MTTELAGTVFSLEKTIFAKFYSPNCKYSKLIKEDFTNASRHFKQILFLNIDCTKFSSVCKQYFIVGFPTLLLFKKGKLPYITFNRVRTTQSMIDFIEEKTLINNITYSKKPVYKISGASYAAFSRPSPDKCNIIGYFVPWHRISIFVKEYYSLTAYVFRGDSHVNFAEVNCDIYQDLCKGPKFGNGLTIPFFTIHTNGKTHVKGSFFTIEEGVDIVNQICGTNRLTNGHLKDNVGVDDTLVTDVTKFADIFYRNETSKKEMVEWITASEKGPMGKFMSVLMQKIVFNGTKILDSIYNKTSMMLDKDDMSISKHDDLDVRFNIIKMFINIFLPNKM